MAYLKKANIATESELLRMTREIEVSKRATAEAEKHASLLTEKLRESERSKALLKTALGALNKTTTK